MLTVIKEYQKSKTKTNTKLDLSQTFLIIYVTSMIPLTFLLIIRTTANLRSKEVLILFSIKSEALFMIIKMQKRTIKKSFSQFLL
jgi:hypothetical protein